MILAYWFVLAAAVLPYLLILYAKATPEFRDSEYNKNPREYEEQRLSGARQRAYWAHLNGFEAFPPFAAGVIIARASSVAVPTINLIAGLFIACRIVHGILYVSNQDKLRSLVWFGGFGSMIALYVMAGTV